MSESAVTSPRTPEQHAAVRRRALPIGIAAAICAIGGMVILLRQDVDEVHLPPLLGVNLSFCAMMMGVGILFYAKGTPGTRTAVGACIVAVVVGLAGPLVFARQAALYRKAAETRELANVTEIALAARQYAQANDGHYPADIAVLLEAKLISGKTLKSPYERGDRGTEKAVEQALSSKQWKSRDDMLKFIDEHVDYQYFGSDLRLPEKAGGTGGAATAPAVDRDLFKDILVVSRNFPIERKHLSIAFTDGRAEFIGLRDAEAVLTGSNRARQSFGFPNARPPESVRAALEAERREMSPGK